MKTSYFSKNHAKFLIKYHIILVVKYRKSLLDIWLCDILRCYFNQTFLDFSIDYVGFDNNHIHILINSAPKLSPLQIVRKIKQETTILVWKIIPNILKLHFWKEKTFWSDGYFISTCEEMSLETIENYIQNQGRNSSPKLKT